MAVSCAYFEIINYIQISKQIEKNSLYKLFITYIYLVTFKLIGLPLIMAFTTVRKRRQLYKQAIEESLISFLLHLVN